MIQTFLLCTNHIKINSEVNRGSHIAMQTTISPNTKICLLKKFKELWITLELSSYHLFSISIWSHIITFVALFFSLKLKYLVPFPCLPTPFTFLWVVMFYFLISSNISFLP